MTIDEELDVLTDNLRRLKIEYEVFFNGGSKKPPTDLRSRVENLLKKYSDTQKLTSHQRFRYNTLASRFSVFSDLWRTRMRAKEEGSDSRGRYADLTAETEPPGTAPRTPPPPEFLFQEIIHSPSEERDKVRKLYETLQQCQQQSHGAFRLPSLDAFENFVSLKATELMRKEHCDRVAFVIVVTDNQVKFQASPVRERERSSQSTSARDRRLV